MADLFLENVCAQLIARCELDRPAWLPPEASRNSAFLSALLQEVSHGLPTSPVPGIAHQIEYFRLAIARQYEDEARYRKSADTLAQHVTRLIELGEPERASFLAEYVIDYWRDNGWAELVGDGIEQLTRLTLRVRTESSLPRHSANATPP